MEVSNAHRVVFPDAGFTKGDVVEHYRRAGAAMLPHVAGRPLTLERFPRGLSHAGFMQKNTPDHYPDTIRRHEVPTRDGGVTTYGIIEDAELLPYLANQGTIAFHVWSSRHPDLEEPVEMVIDLDPEEGDVSRVRELAFAAREMLDSFGAESFPVATGSKGYHLRVPLRSGHTYPQISRASRAIAELLALHYDELATTEFLKKNRGGKVFVDWLRNQPTAAAVAPYSLRPRPYAPVAVPLAWDEVATIDPAGWTIDTVAARLDNVVSSPRPVQLDIDAITGEAISMGVDLDTTFDRFGRTS